MAREWWQFSNWPDDEHPNAVEIWQPGTLPNPCTIWRAEWLNQFVAWKYYLQHQLPNQSTWWLKGYAEYGGRLEWNWTQSFPVQVRSGLQSPAFWEWLGTLECGNWMRALPIPHGLGGEGDVEVSEGTPAGFVNDAAFQVRVADSPSSDWFADLPYVSNYSAQTGKAIPWWHISHGTNLQQSLRLYLQHIRERWETAGVNTGYGGIAEWLGGHDGYRRSLDISADPDEDGKYPWGPWVAQDGGRFAYNTVPWPYYRSGLAAYNYVRAGFPYEDIEEGGETIATFCTGDGRIGGSAPGPGRASYEAEPHTAWAEYLTGVDVFRLSDSNYRYAVVSYEDEGSDGDAPANVPQPSQHGFCHALFDLNTAVDPEHKPSEIVALRHGGSRSAPGNSAWNYSRRLDIVAYPYDRLPDAYKGPGWPTVDDGNGGTMLYLPLDRSYHPQQPSA